MATPATPCHRCSATSSGRQSAKLRTRTGGGLIGTEITLGGFSSSRAVCTSTVAGWASCRFQRADNESVNEQAGSSRNSTPVTDGRGGACQLKPPSELV
jgi:hypothetical protein